MHVLEVAITTASSASIHTTPPTHSKPTSPPGELDPVSDLQNVNDFMLELQRVQIASRLDRMEVAIQASAGVTGRMTNGFSESFMMGDVNNRRAIVPHALQPLLQASVEKVELAAGSAPMAADTKRKAIFDQMSGGKQLNDLFGRAGAQSVSYSACTFTKKSEGMSGDDGADDANVAGVRRPRQGRRYYHSCEVFSLLPGYCHQVR
jgi:hypothetical protein